ncbi:MAG: TlpA family protein disulfide reductase [Bacteroidales bacterium]|nr:TlpA family protein disulfide reductase [Bacteroidales bacterium]
MKNIFVITLFLIVSDCFSQSNYYKLYNDSIYNQKRFDTYLDKMLKTLPAGYIVTPTIYHKQHKPDSIINFFTVVMTKGTKQVDNNKVKIIYKQDPVFMLLDKKLPKFTLKDINDKDFSSSQLIGKPSLINFWSIQCAPCILEFPELDKLIDKYGNKVNFISISENSKSEVLNLLKQKPFHFYHLVDGYDFKKSILKDGSIPKNIFLDRNGNVFEIKGGIPIEKDIITGKSKMARYQFEYILDRLLKL